MITLRNVEVLGSSGLRDIVIDDSASSDLTITFENALAFPGLVNSHDHLEFDAYEQLGGGPYQDYVEWAEDFHRRHAATIAVVEAIPRRERIRAGIARNLMCGVTTVAHHGDDPDYSASPIHIIRDTRTIHSPRLGNLRGMVVPDRRTVVAHIGEGTNREAVTEIDNFLRWNVWRKPLIGVHAITMRPDQARQFDAIVWCAMSNEFLFGRTAPISTLKSQTTILLGTDSTLTGPWSIWDHIRRARELGDLTDEELIAALTSSAARIWKLHTRGDMVVARKKNNDLSEAFFSIVPEDILLVVRGGEIVLIDEQLRSQMKGQVNLSPLTRNGITKYAAL